MLIPFLIRLSKARGPHQVEKINPQSVSFRSQTFWGEIPKTLIIIFLASSGVSLAELQSQPPEVGALEKGALAQRRSITSGHVILDEMIWGIKEGKKEPQYVRRMEIWFEGDKIRGDTKYPSTPGPSFDAPMQKAVNSFANGEHISWIDDSATGSWAASIKRESQNSASIVEQVPNPRAIGMIPCVAANLVNFHLESILGRPDRTSPTTKPSVIGGIRCWQVSYKFKNQVGAKVWYSPEHGNSVLRIEVQTKDKAGNETVRDTIQSELVKIPNSPNSDLWFPKACLYERFENKKLVKMEELKVEEIKINVPIDPKTFTLEGIKLKPGTKVYDMRSDKYLPPRLWNGKKLVGPEPAVEKPEARIGVKIENRPVFPHGFADSRHLFPQPFLSSQIDPRSLLPLLCGRFIRMSHKLSDWFIRFSNGLNGENSRP